MSTALERVGKSEVIASNDDAASFMAVIAAAARDPQVDVAKMQQLLEMRERLMQKEAETAFNAAFARLQQKLPAIPRTAKGHNNKYAPFEEIQKLIQRPMDEEGFSLSFTSAPGAQPGTLRIEGKLSHVSGHSRQPSGIDLPFDKSGSMNPIQGIGSTFSYGQRYVAKGLLNLRFIGDDDDGHAAGYISPQQVSTILDMVNAAELDGKSVAGFLKFMNAPRIEEIQAQDFERGMAALRQKLAVKQRGDK